MGYGFNSVLRKFISLVSSHLVPVLDLRRKLAGSQVFTAYLIEKRARYIALPSYSEVRWYSLVNLCRLLSDLSQLISSFWPDERSEPFPEAAFTLFEQVMSLLETVTKATEAIEGERFSTIMYALLGFDQIRVRAKELSETSKQVSEVCDTWAEYYQQVETVMQLRIREL